MGLVAGKEYNRLLFLGGLRSDTSEPEDFLTRDMNPYA